MRKAGIFVIALLIASAAGYYLWTGFAAKQAAPKLDLAKTATKVERRDLEKVIALRGTVKAPVSSEIKSEVNGRILRILVGPGDVVKKGDLLIELNKSDIQNQIDGETHQIVSTRLRAEKMKLDLGREKQLLDHSLVPQKEYDDMNIDTELALNELDVEAAKLASLKEELSKTSILAPHDGTILKVDVTEGGVIAGAGGVTAGTSLMTLADLSHLEVTSEVNEIDVTQLAVDMPVHLSFDSLPDLKLEGTIRFISPSAIPKEEQKTISIFPLVVSVTKTDPKVKVGLSARIKIPVCHADKALCLPISLVSDDGDEDSSFVYVVENGLPVKRAVTVGIQDAKYIEIKSGLKEGEAVSLTGPPTAK